MNKLSIFLSCTLILCCAQAMNYEVIGTVERAESVNHVSIGKLKIITYTAEVQESVTNALFHVTVARMYNPVFGGPLDNAGKFWGIIAPVLENKEKGIMRFLQTNDAIELFSQLSDAYAVEKLVNILLLKQAHQALLKRVEEKPDTSSR